MILKTVVNRIEEKLI